MMLVNLRNGAKKSETKDEAIEFFQLIAQGRSDLAYLVITFVYSDKDTLFIEGHLFTDFYSMHNNYLPISLNPNINVKEYFSNRERFKNLIITLAKGKFNDRLHEEYKQSIAGKIEITHSSIDSLESQFINNLFQKKDFFNKVKTCSESFHKYCETCEKIASCVEIL